MGAVREHVLLMQYSQNICLMSKLYFCPYVWGWEPEPENEVYDRCTMCVRQVYDMCTTGVQYGKPILVHCTLYLRQHTHPMIQPMISATIPTIGPTNDLYRGKIEYNLEDLLIFQQYMWTIQLNFMDYITLFPFSQSISLAPSICISSPLSIM